MIIPSAFKSLNGKHSSGVARSCETLIAARCNHLKMEINDKPHLKKREARLVMNHVSQLLCMKADAAYICLCARLCVYMQL